jgi:hypothetical protein
MVYGDGFIISPQTRHSLIAESPKNSEVVTPYLNGKSFNNMVTHTPDEYVINFGCRELKESQNYALPFSVVTELVKPYRDKLQGQIHEHRYWLFWDKRERFYKIIQKLDRVLVTAITSKYLTFDFFDTDWVFSHAVKVFAFSNADYFGVLQSTIHDVWSRIYSSSLGQTLRYSTSAAFDTFAWPTEFQGVTEIGERYYKYRRMAMASHNLGFTNLYNLFHDPSNNNTDIQKLRDLHVEMDQAVTAAYGWTDLELGHDFHETKQGVRFTISEAARREVLQRLLKLNHERYAEEEKQGLHDKKGGAKKSASKNKVSKIQETEQSLFDLKE